MAGTVTKQTGKTPILGVFRGAFLFVFLVSGVINVLALTGSLYMLQIYDRALTSQSVETLLVLSGLAIGLYLLQGLLDVGRSQIMVRIGAETDRRLAPIAHRVTIDMPRFGYSVAEARERSRDVDTLRQFLAGPGPIAVLDLPWMPVYVAFIYILHPILALLVIGGALVLGVLTLVAEVLTRHSINASQQSGRARATMADSHMRNIEVVRAMGFIGRAIARYDRENQEHLRSQMRASDVGGTIGGVSKVLRVVLQSAVLGVGAYLTIGGELTAGAIIAASVASARALAPMDMMIGQWKALVAARRSHRRLTDTLAAVDTAPPLVVLPSPTASLKVERVTVAAPGTGAVLLSDVSFELQAGQALGLIGPSGSGKSTLARALTGVWPMLRGSVRLDDADITQWNSDALGMHLGYLPQDVALLDGTVAENIARFDPNPDSLTIIEAARMAGVHEMILRLSGGYETQLGAHGTALSAGQRQRIGLARAVYGAPFLVVLDEPNSNLDSEGEAALGEAIEGLRRSGSIVVVIAHRPSALRAVDTVGVMQAGKLVAFGARDEILAGAVAVPAPRARPAVAVPVPVPVAASGHG